MDGLDEIIKLITDNGLAIVIAAIFLIFVWREHKRKIDYEEKNKQRDDRIRDLEIQRLEKKKDTTEAWESQMQALIWQMATKSLERQELIDDDIKTVDINKTIKKALNEGLSEIQAQRGMFFSYHNGTEDYNGKHFQRMSCINEVTQCGTAPLQNKMTDIFRTSFFYLYKELSEKGFFNIPNTESLKEEDPGFYTLCQEMHIKASFGATIMNKNANVIGFIIYCFAAPQDDVSKIVEIVKKAKYKVEGAYMTE